MTDGSGPRVLVADWSGAAAVAAQRRHIAVAESVDGRVVAVSTGRSRADTVDALVTEVSAAAAAGHRLVVGLDFAFSFPQWFCEATGAAEVGDVWRTAARCADEWLAETPPFWGRRTRRPDLGDRPHLRRCEVGTGARSVFQIGGAGAVGTASVRGMPALLRLRDAGAAIWPFDPPAPVQVCEVWPRLSIGTLRKSDSAARSAWLDERSDALAPDVRALAATSEDVFDAVAAAWDLGRRPALRTPLPRAGDPTEAIEGAILDPNDLDSDLDSGVDTR